jgi:hypothetical protein
MVFATNFSALMPSRIFDYNICKVSVNIVFSLGSSYSPSVDPPSLEVSSPLGVLADGDWISDVFHRECTSHLSNVKYRLNAQHTHVKIVILILPLGGSLFDEQ